MPAIKVEERRSVLAVVQDVDGEAGFRFETLPDRFDSMRVRFGSLKEAAIPSDRLLRGIAGLRLELVTHENHRVVGKRWVGKDHAHLDLILLEE
jgi:hypothetical protein